MNKGDQITIEFKIEIRRIKWEYQIFIFICKGFKFFKFSFDIVYCQRDKNPNVSMTCFDVVYLFDNKQHLIKEKENLFISLIQTKSKIVKTFLIRRMDDNSINN